MRKRDAMAAWLIGLALVVAAGVGAITAAERPLPEESRAEASYPRMVPVPIDPCAAGACW